MAVRRVTLVASLVALAVHAGCTSPRTEIVVVVDTDLSVPGEIDSIAVVATAPDDRARESSIGLLDRSELPATVGLVHESGPLGPFEVRAVGRLAGRDVVERLARVSFVERQTLVLPMHLAGACVGVSCGAERTCTEEGCADVDVDSGQLDRWDGTPPRLEGSDGDADVDGDGDSDLDAEADAPTDADVDECSPTDELCNGLDDDCDGEVDEDFLLDTDPSHCGSCDRSCDFRNGTGECSGGVCVVLTCDPDFDDCNHSGLDGCETDLLADVDHCGDCTTTCRGGRVCCAGTCLRPPCP